MTIRLALLFLTASAGLGVTRPAGAQHAHDLGAQPATLDSAHVAFLQTAEQALAAFPDPASALAAGFRPLGPDMPHMGQHWVHPGRAVGRSFHPAEPSMLTYLPVEGRATLTGAAWTVPVGPGVEPPDFPWPGAWHAHAGRLMDEAFGLVPHGARDADRPRLAMLHAWTGVPNPDGPFAPDNWALPFARVGVPAPAHITPDAGRAVALAAGYLPFYREAVVRASSPDAKALAVIDAVLAHHAERIRARLVAAPDRPLNVDVLAHDWHRLGAEMQAAVPSLWPQLAPLFGADGHTGTHAIADDEPQR